MNFGGNETEFEVLKRGANALCRSNATEGSKSFALCQSNADLKLKQTLYVNPMQRKPVNHLLYVNPIQWKIVKRSTQYIKV